MAWYTTGPGGFRHRYGDVLAAARASGLGRVSLVPRVTAADADGDLIEVDTDDVEFLRDIQLAIAAAGLPWRPVELVDDGYEVPLDVDLPVALIDLAGRVAEHAPSVREVIAAVAGPVTIAELMVSVDIGWSVAADDVPGLSGWAAGGDDESRRLVRAALDHVAADGSEEFWLEQPDDDHVRSAWQFEPVLLVRPSDHPFVDLLARGFGVAPAIRECVFYVHSGPSVPLPVEGPTGPDDQRDGLAFARCLGVLLNGVIDGLSPPGPAARAVVGWHADGSLDELRRAFRSAGRVVRTVDAALATVREPWHGLPAPDRLATLSYPEVTGFVLEGREPCPTTPLPQVGVLLVLLERFDGLTPAQVGRLGRLLRAATAT